MLSRNFERIVRLFVIAVEIGAVSSCSTILGLEPGHLADGGGSLADASVAAPSGDASLSDVARQLTDSGPAGDRAPGSSSDASADRLPPACVSGATRQCSEDAAKPALGNCATGQQTCTNGQWSPCSVTPKLIDACTASDDANCNGTANEGCPCLDGATQSCGPVAQVGACRRGTQTCAGRAWGECVGAVLARPRDCTAALDLDCNGTPDNQDPLCGCTAGSPSLLTDPQNCGACGQDCSALPNVRPGATSPSVQCVAGRCLISTAGCAAGFAHCTSRADDGCETDLTRPATCGSCTTACMPPLGLCSTAGGTPSCASSCVAPTASLCGSKCVDLKTDPTNCGVCAHDCTALPYLRSTQGVTCNGSGGCVVGPTACAPGYGNCIATVNDVDGCETRLNSNTNCGGCGVACSPPNATGDCSTGQCVVSGCAAGFGDCTSVAGCETRLNTVDHCGSCTTTCPGPSTTCTGTPLTCGCAAGFTNCLADGCRNVTTDLANCRSCGNACHQPPPSAGSAVCGAAGCDVTCNAGYVKCSGPPSSCGATSWTFESGTTEGFSARPNFPQRLSGAVGSSTVRSRTGTRSLAIPVSGATSANGFGFLVTTAVCSLPGPIPSAGKTLSMWVYLDGPALIASSVSAYLFDISLNAPVGTPVVATNQWTQITVPADTVGPTVTEFGVWGSFLSAWTGTIYVDDITLR